VWSTGAPDQILWPASPETNNSRSGIAAR